MDTVAKGNSFEDEMFVALKNELSNGRLGLMPEHCKIYQRKGYYSKYREKNIIVDISIEVWPPKAQNYSFLWICECKNYEHKVPVDDVEEFNSKLDQIAGKNIKGVIATKNSFQRGTLTYAKNKGIGLVRIMPDAQITWMMHMMSNLDVMNEKLNPQIFREALTSEDFQSNERDFYAISNGYIYESWQSLLRHTFNIFVNKDENVISLDP